MRCPFDTRFRWPKVLIGTDPGFVDYALANEERRVREFNERYPTCWLKFRKWLGFPARPADGGR